MGIVALIAGATVWSLAEARPVAASAPGFTAVTPARLWDTRSGAGIATADRAFEGTGRLGAGSPFRLQIAGRGGVPTTGVTAVAINVTAIAPDAPSFVTVYPAVQSRPDASNLNLAPGRTLPNMVIVPLSASGEIDVFNAAGTTDLAIDVFGWFGGGFTGLTPARLWESRPGLATVDGTANATGRLGPNVAFTLQVTGRGGVPAAGVGAVAVNVTAIDPAAASFLTVYPAGQQRPNASNLNLAPGRTLPNMVIVPLSAAGQVEIFNAAGTTDVAVDVLGWFPSTASALTPLAPERLWETRPGLPTTDGAQQGTGRVGAGASGTVQVTGRGGVPAGGVSAVVVNITAIAPDSPSFLTAFAAGGGRPGTSNLNLAPDRTLPNMAIVPVSASGQIEVFNAAGSTDVAVDVLGWFPAAPTVNPIVNTYGTTNLPGRLIVNSVPGPGRGAAFDLRTGQRVVLPASAPGAINDRWTTGARPNSVVRTTTGSSSTTITVLDSATFGTVQSSITKSNSLRAPLVSPDGRYLLTFWYDVSSGETVANDQLTVFDAQTGDVVEFGSNLDGVSVLSTPAAWMPDGSYIYLAGKTLYRTRPNDPITTPVATLALPGPTPTSVSRTALAVSPDGSKIALTWREERGVSNDVNVWTVNADGSGLARLTSAPDPTSPLDFTHGSPTWSPDGQWVAAVLYMSGTSSSPVYPDEPFLGARVTGSTGCIDQVVVVPAAGPAVSLDWPSFDADRGIKVATPSGPGGQWLSTCGGTISWLP
jgi:hypothetical protein